MQVREAIGSGLAIAFALAGVVLPSSTRADTIAISSTVPEVVGGLSVGPSDVASYDTVANTATLLFSGALITGASNVDGFHVAPNGHFLISTATGETLGGLSFSPADIVDYNPSTNTATLFFDGDLIAGTADVDALALLPDGRLVISTVFSETLAGVSFLDGDLVAYNLITGVAEIYLLESSLGSMDIDAVHVLSDGRILLSTRAGETLGALGFTDGDIVMWDPVAQLATLYLDEDAMFATDAELDALAGIDMTDTESQVPEPSGLVLLGLTLAGSALARRRSRS